MAKSKNLIVTLRNSMSDCVGDLLASIALGRSFGIQNGHHGSQPKSWREGPASLKLSVGKRKRLIRGTLSVEYEGRGSDDRESYSWIFTPKPRVFPLKDRIAQRMKDNQRESIVCFFAEHNTLLGKNRGVFS